MASPHTRGWTRRHAADDHVGPGFPAHAGMDPGRSAACYRRPRLPRTRGDGPPSMSVVPMLTEASPHTRGWTRHGRRHLPQRRGFPAHAGMDPIRTPRREWSQGLPRTRGDGPDVDHSRPESDAASPHTRGWTRQGQAERRVSTGFPAHAGMDPRSRRRSWRTTRLPRTRGDGPGGNSPRREAVQASPHTRGWTPVPCLLERSKGGFPAHAGMDPAWRARHWSGSRLPRTRGDGPLTPLW